MELVIKPCEFIGCAEQVNSTSMEGKRRIDEPKSVDADAGGEEGVERRE